MPQKKAAAPAKAYGSAIRRLARRDHSVAELGRALGQRGYQAAEVEQTIARLLREGYLDDARYAERFARSRLAHQGLGSARIRQALRQRGIPRAEARAGLASALREIDEARVLDRLARRYWKQHLALEPARRLPRLWAFLLRRGFAPGLVRTRLSGLWPRWADALEGLAPAEDEPAQEQPGDEP
jgi:regulatory protein